MPQTPFHTPVLLQETLSLLAPAPGGTYVDATLGGGGHAEAILRQLGGRGCCIGIDADAEALAAATDRLRAFGTTFIPVHENFSNLASVLSQLRVGPVSGVLFDLGVSSHQLDDASRGFSFRGDERLDMRMDQGQQLTASVVLNTYAEQDLVTILRTFGEERFARRIARLITERRRQKPFATTGELADCVDRAVGGHHAVKSRARVFQAIRIEVNRELERLEQGLFQGLEALQPGGRIVTISYHSLEDRIVKNFFRNASKTVEHSGTKLIPDARITPRARVLTKKPVEALDAEVNDNPRARSAKLRAAEKL